MPLYAALLRAINLAGKNKVGMADLRGLCDGLGFEETTTLLQSGNLVVRANAGAGALERLLHEETKKKLGVETDFFVRTVKEWEQVLAKNPYPNHAKRDPGHLLVMFLKDSPDKKQAAALDEAIIGRETAHVHGRHAYIYYPDGVGTSRLTNAKIEKGLATRGTGRNWNTVTKLATMLGLLLGIAAFGAGCAKKESPVPTIEVGHVRVQLQTPAGWEHLDHGRQQLFRKGEAEVSLSDLGPSSRTGVMRELGEARKIWLSGRRQDAFAKVRGLRSPELHFATSGVWTGFWRAWNLLMARSAVDSSDIAAGFDSLFVAAGALPPIGPADQVRYAFQNTSDMRRREITQMKEREIGGYTWMEAMSWDRTTHGNPMRVAILDDHGYLLALWTERGLIEQTGPVFESLLTSIRVVEVVESTSAAAARP